MSLRSWMEFRLLLAMTRVSRPGNMRPSLRTSAQSCSRLSVMCSKRRLGQGSEQGDTLVYSLRQRNSSSSLDRTEDRGEEQV